MFISLTLVKVKIQIFTLTRPQNIWSRLADKRRADGCVWIAGGYVCKSIIMSMVWCDVFRPLSSLNDIEIYSIS